MTVSPFRLRLISFIGIRCSFPRQKRASGIDAVNVSKRVPDKNAHGKISLVTNVTFRIEAGEFVAIVGGSGAGKSTLLDCINGMRPATDGKIYYDTNDYYENMNTYKGVIGYVPQRDIMHDDLTVAQGLRYTAMLRMRADVSEKELAERVNGAIADVRLQGKEKLRISSLSGGQKKRVSIAMELLSDPKVIFLDEPTSGLSPDLDMEMMGLLKELAKKGRTIVVITHAMENLDKCDRVAFLGNGGSMSFTEKSKRRSVGSTAAVILGSLPRSPILRRAKRLPRNSAAVPIIRSSILSSLRSTARIAVLRPSRKRRSHLGKNRRVIFRSRARSN